MDGHTFRLDRLWEIWRKIFWRPSGGTVVGNGRRLSICCQLRDETNVHLPLHAWQLVCGGTTSFSLQFWVDLGIMLQWCSLPDGAWSWERERESTVFKLFNCWFYSMLKKEVNRSRWLWADGNDTSRCKGGAGGVVGNGTVYRFTVSWVFFTTLLTLNEK
jgi:hypothetical protein